MVVVNAAYDVCCARHIYLSPQDIDRFRNARYEAFLLGDVNDIETVLQFLNKIHQNHISEADASNN